MRYRIITLPSQPSSSPHARTTNPNSGRIGNRLCVQFSHSGRIGNRFSHSGRIGNPRSCTTNPISGRIGNRRRLSTRGRGIRWTPAAVENVKFRQNRQFPSLPLRPSASLVRSVVRFRIPAESATTSASPLLAGEGPGVRFPAESATTSASPRRADVGALPAAPVGGALPLPPARAHPNTRRTQGWYNTGGVAGARNTCNARRLP